MVFNTIPLEGIQETPRLSLIGEIERDECANGSRGVYRIFAGDWMRVDWENCLRIIAQAFGRRRHVLNPGEF
jgi:hypothetical protein